MRSMRRKIGQQDQELAVERQSEGDEREERLCLRKGKRTKPWDREARMIKSCIILSFSRYVRLISFITFTV